MSRTFIILNLLFFSLCVHLEEVILKSIAHGKLEKERSISYESEHKENIFDDLTYINVSLFIQSLEENFVGKKGTIVVDCFYDAPFDYTDKTKKTYFKTSIKNGNNSYEINCGFWPKEISEFHIRLFCNIDENIPAGDYLVNFDGSIIYYQNFSIRLSQRDYLNFDKFDMDIIDLYSDNQAINVVEDKDLYELKFKIVSYNHEKLILGSYIFLDCNQKKDELICKVSKDELERISGSETNVMYI